MCVYNVFFLCLNRILFRESSIFLPGQFTLNFFLKSLKRYNKNDSLHKELSEFPGKKASSHTKIGTKLALFFVANHHLDIFW